MKNRKVLGLLVGVCGMAISVGAAAALYVKTVEDKGFGFGGATFTEATGSMSYVVGTVDQPTGDAAKVSPDHKSITVKYPLAFKYGTDIDASYEKQVYEFGQAKVSVYGSEALMTIATVTTKFVGQFQEGGYWEEVAMPMSEMKDIIDGQTAYKGFDTSKTVPVNVVADTVTPTIAGQPYVEVKVDFALNGNFNLSLAEQDWHIHLDWGDVANDYVAPYVAGDGNGWATNLRQYRMVINAKANAFQWMYTGLVGFTQYKVVKGTTWYGGYNGSDPTTWNSLVEANVAKTVSATANIYMN